MKILLPAGYPGRGGKSGPVRTEPSSTGHKSFLSSQESFLRGGTVSMYRFAM